MENNLAFHAILEREICQLEFGQIDVTVIIKNGQIILPTINILKSKRIKYKDGARTSKE
jgi:flagellar biosynthesis/type III secretory pathway chaperone